MPHGIERVGDEIVQHLANVIFQAKHRRLRVVCSLDLDARICQPTAVEVQHRAYQLLRRNQRRPHRLAMEAQRLLRDLAYPG